MIKLMDWYSDNNKFQMNLQKNKGSAKKLKQNKSETNLQLPLAPLIKQINQLKSELASMKSKRTIKLGIDVVQQRNKNNKDTLTTLGSPKSQLKEDKTMQKIFTAEQDIENLKSIIFPIREHELKINIEINKLGNSLKQNQLKMLTPTLNKIITEINIAIEDLTFQTRLAQAQSSSNDILYNWKEQAKTYQKLSNELQRENIEYKHIMAKQVDDINNLETINEELKQEYELLAKTVGSLENQLQKMKLICDGMRDQRQQLEEKIKVYQRSIEKKQSELIMYEQDINYSRIQSQKHKVQKKQLQKLYDNLQKQYKQLKCKYETEVESLLREKNKWKYECENRRATETEVINYQQHKNQLKKQIQNMRQQIAVLNEQIGFLKTRLHEQQKKNMIHEQQNYRLANQNQKMTRSVAFCKAEIQELTKQVQELRQESSKYKELAIKSKAGIKNANKAQALEQIHQLIKQHKKHDI